MIINLPISTPTKGKKDQNPVLANVESEIRLGLLPTYQGKEAQHGFASRRHQSYITDSLLSTIFTGIHPLKQKSCTSRDMTPFYIHRAVL